MSAIAAALEKTGWNRKAAARALKVSYRSLLYKIEQYHMVLFDLVQQGSITYLECARCRLPIPARLLKRRGNRVHGHGRKVTSLPAPIPCGRCYSIRLPCF